MTSSGGAEMVYKLIWCYLHDEVAQTLLQAEGEILPTVRGGQDCYIYSERLTVGAGREVEVGR